MEKEYIVGIDFGHGETSAWLVPIHGNSQGEALRIRNAAHANEKVCPSWVYRDKKGNYSLVQTVGSCVRFGFKAKPVALDQNPEQKEAFAAYIKLIILALLQNNTELKIDLSGGPNFILCVACPTRWSEYDKRSYLSFLSNAMVGTKVEPMWVINESDAAFFSWVGSPDDSFKVGANDCTLVIDYGSSTIDYTMMRDGKKVSDDSWSNPNLGASLVEIGIVDDYKNKNFDAYQRFLSATINECIRTGNSQYDADEIESCLITETRIAKENVFKNGTWPNMNRMVFSMFDRCGGYAAGFDTMVDLKIGGSLLEKPLLMDYQNAVKMDFEKLKQYVDNKVGANHLKHIILSGGACLMTWVRPMVLQVFGQNISVHMDNAPAYVVSKGIAYYAKAQLDALKNLRDAVGQIDFESIYKKADMQATAESINQMSYVVKDAVLKYSGPDAGDIHLEFRKFLLGLDGRNESYCEVFRKELNNTISREVHVILNRIIQDRFAKEIQREDVRISLDVPVFNWPSVDGFNEGGRYFNLFKQWIESTAVACGIASDNILGINALNWEKSRTDYERDQLVNGTITRMVDYFKNNSDAISYDRNDLKEAAGNIKNQVLQITERLFYEQQLFETTFVG